MLATVQDGDGAFSVRWARDLGGTVSGVTVQPTSSGARVLAATGGDLVALRDDGGNAGRAPAPQGTGRVRLDDVTGDGKADLIGWRRGSTTVGVLDLAERAATSWASEAPVFGLAVAPADHMRPEPTLVLATTAGLRYHAADGAIVARGDDHARDVDVDVEREATSASGASTAFLDADGRLVRVGRNGELVSTRAVSDDPRRLVLDAGDSIVASGVETDLFVPHRVDGDRPLAAVTSGACLHVLDAATGEPIWRAAWTEPIEQVAAGDLDRDGIAELVVASGDSVVVLDRSIVTEN